MWGPKYARVVSKHQGCASRIRIPVLSCEMNEFRLPKSRFPRILYCGAQVRARLEHVPLERFRLRWRRHVSPGQVR